MIYCINPDCKQRQNPDGLDYCKTCDTPLLVDERYRLIKPMRQLDPRNYTDIFEVDDGGTRKVLKVLKDNSPQLVEMFEREAFTLQLLNHPGIPKVDIDGYFTFTPNDSDREIHCLVMEKIEGQNLEEWLAKNKPISQSQALNWLKQLVKILEQIHQNGLFHRDIKPSNIILKPDGQLVLIDFGSVREISNTYLAKLKGGLNITTIFSGGYTPQEQVDGKATPQSDLFALGRTFVHLMTGKSPVELPTNPKTGKLIWQDKAPQISKPLADFIDDELMAPSPADRPQDTKIILRDLNPKGLFFKSILRLLNSPKFKVLSIGLLAVGVSSGIIYRASFPLFSQQYYEKGVAELNVNQLDSARKYFEQAIEFNPKDARIYNNLGLICQRQKDFACAKINYDKALKLDPNNPVARYNLGGFYDDSGDFDRAEVEYQRAAKYNTPVAVNATNNLARLRILQGETDKAIVLISQGLQKTENPKVRSALYKNLGWSHLIQTDYNKAEANLRKAIELNSKQNDSYCLLAQVLEARSEKGEALLKWKNCLNGDSRNRVEVMTWQTMARQRLKDAGERE